MRDGGLDRIPPERAAGPVRLFRHAVRVMLGEHRQAEGRRQSKAGNLLERLRDRETEILCFTEGLRRPFRQTTVRSVTFASVKARIKSRYPGAVRWRAHTASDASDQGLQFCRGQAR